MALVRKIKFLSLFYVHTLLKGAQSHPNWLKKWSHLSSEIAGDSYFLNYFLYFSCQIQIEIRWLVLRLQGYFLNFLRCNGTLRISLWLLWGKLWQFQLPGTPWFPSEKKVRKFHIRFFFKIMYRVMPMKINHFWIGCIFM